MCARRQQRTLKQLVAGVTRWRRRLDHSLAGLSGRSADGLEPGVRQVLRLALYELTHLGLVGTGELPRERGGGRGLGACGCGGSGAHWPSVAVTRDGGMAWLGKDRLPTDASTAFHMCRRPTR